MASKKKVEKAKPSDEPEIVREICFPQIFFGCDPEIFFRKGEKVVSSEEILPADGLDFDKIHQTVGGATPDNDNGSDAGGCVVIDGIQAELNPQANTCRANLGSRISQGLLALRDHLKGFPGIEIDWNGTINVSRDDLAQMSERARLLGCAPSLNVYDPDATIGVDPNTYTKRSAGGHIHIGMQINKYKDPCVKDLSKLVLLIDIIVGNTCVLFDRDPNAAERRRVYGRAGEYRLPKHGLEYRTLSNFWLRSYELFSFVMGLTRLATGLVHTSEKGSAERKKIDKEATAAKGYTQYVINPNKDRYGYTIGNYYLMEEIKYPNYVAELLSKVDQSAIVAAINENDFDLARRNFNQVRDFLSTIDNLYCADSDNAWPLGKNVWDEFDYFIDTGLDRWFSDDPFMYWSQREDGTGQTVGRGAFNGHNCGWETFLLKVVRNQMRADRTWLKSRNQSSKAA